MRKVILLGVSSIFSALVITACYYHHAPEEFLYSNVSYSTQVKPILEDKCYRCHSAGATDPDKPSGGPYWDDFNQLKMYATTPSGVNANYSILVARLKGIESPQMPYLSAPLTADEIRIIQSWGVLGAPNN